MLVMKFGGTSVKDADAIRRLTAIVARARMAATRTHADAARAVGGPIVVVSALSKVTDALLTIARNAEAGDADSIAPSIDALSARHHEVAAGAVRDPERLAALGRALDSDLAELSTLAHALSVVHDASPRLQDAIAAIGELLSSRIVAAALEQAGLPATWLDARTVLVTNAESPASPLMDETRARCRELLLPLVARGSVPVVGGFIGATTGGVTTTLGRGGSDYSASVFGVGVGADEIQIWTDVDGMLTADPRLIERSRPLPRLSFAEASELAYFGAKVLHPSTIIPAVAEEIPVRILNSQRPDVPGTLITRDGGAASSISRSGESGRGAYGRGVTGPGASEPGVPPTPSRTERALGAPPPTPSRTERALGAPPPTPSRTERALGAPPGPLLTAIACKRDVTVIDIVSTRMLMAHGFLRRLFEVFERHRTAVDVVTTSEVSVSVTIDDVRRLDEIVRDLRTFAEVTVTGEMALVCAVGERLRTDPSLSARVVGALDGFGLRMVSQAGSRRNVTFVLPQGDLVEAMQRLHERFCLVDLPEIATPAAPSLAGQAPETPAGSHTERI